MPWYEQWFDSDAYEVVYRQRNLEEASRLIDLVERAAQPAPAARILDVACGRGRHARLLARRGYRVTGVDLSEKAIQTARRRAEQEGVEVDFRVGDMRELPFENQFDGAVNLFTSFGYFDDDVEHERAVARMARALVPGGFLVQDFLNPAFAVANLIPEDEWTIESGRLGEVTVRQRRWINGADPARRINKHIELVCLKHPDGEPDRFVFHESVRLLDRADFERMYDAAGLAVEAVFGDYHGRAHGAESPRLILLARRSGEGA